MLSSSVLTQSSRLTKSSKYMNVQKKIDSGLTMRDVVFLTNQQVAHKRSEIFKRISAKKLHSLLQSEPLSQSIVHNNENTQKNSLPIYESFETPKNDFQSLMNRDFILIDLRSEEDFKKYHIQEAINIPAMFFNQDRIPKDLMYYVC